MATRTKRRQEATSFLEHLEDLAVTIRNAAIVLLLFCTAGLVFAEPVLKFLITPYGGKLQTLGPTEGISTLIRVGLTLGAAVCWAIYTSWGAPILTRHSPLRTTAWAMVGGSIVLLPLGLIQAAGADWAAVSAGAWAGFVYSSLIPAGIANVVVFHGIRLLGPTRITALQFLVPFIAVVLGAAFLSEDIQPAQIAGGAVIVLGVAISRALTVGDLAGRLRARWLP